MKTLQSSIAMGAIAASVFVSALAQQNSAPPARVMGSVQVDQITKAPLQIVRSVTLDATPEEAFEFVTDHQNWPRFRAPILSVKVSGNGRKGSTRSFALAGGGSFSERIVAFDKPSGGKGGTFAYSVTPNNPFGVKGHLAVIEFRPADGGGTALHYHQIFDHADLKAIAPRVASGTDEIIANVLYRFGGQLRGSVEGSETVVMTQRRTVEASSDRAWEVLGEQWADIDKWASVIEHSEASGGSGGSLKGAIRSCRITGAPAARERMLAYDENARTFSYQALQGMPPFVTRAVNTWKVETLGKNRAVISSRLELSIAAGTPAAAAGMFKGQFDSLFDLTTDELVHFVETGRPHPRKVASQRAAGGN